MPQVVANIFCNLVYRIESSFVNLFLHTLLHRCKRPAIRRMAMLGPPLHDGLYCMAWTVLAGWRCFLDFAGVLMIWNQSDMHLTSGEIQRRSCSSLG